MAKLKRQGAAYIAQQKQSMTQASWQSKLSNQQEGVYVAKQKQFCDASKVAEQAESTAGRSVYQQAEAFPLCKPRGEAMPMEGTKPHAAVCSKQSSKVGKLNKKHEEAYISKQ